MLLFDKLRLASEREYTDEGFLKVPARISRTGCQVYTAVEMGLTDRDPSDKIMVYRPEEEVFSPESIGSFSGKPITNNHPPVLLSPENYKDYSVGIAGQEITRDGMFLKTILNILDAEAIKNIESGKVELSNGYLADIDWTPGISPDGEQYDAIQRNIKGNHIAIVERGRAGASCRVADNSPESGDAIMAKITIDGVDYEVSDQAAQAVGKLQKRLNDAESEAQTKEEELKSKEDEMEEAKKEAMKSEDALKAKLDDATSKIPNSATIDKMVADRMILVDSVKRVCPEMVVDGKDAPALMREVVSVKCPGAQLDSVSEDYIKARFDILLDAEPETPAYHLDEAFKKPFEKKENEKDTRPPSVIAREKMMSDSRDAWKTGGRK